MGMNNGSLALTRKPLLFPKTLIMNALFKKQLCMGKSTFGSICFCNHEA